VQALFLVVCFPDNHIGIPGQAVYMGGEAVPIHAVHTHQLSERLRQANEIGCFFHLLLQQKPSVALEFNAEASDRWLGVAANKMV
jgi:hypothetical protein